VTSFERLDRAAVEMIPGLLEADLAAIGAKLKLVEPFVQWVQATSTD
jgi:hypothetical protein